MRWLMELIIPFFTKIRWFIWDIFLDLRTGVWYNDNKENICTHLLS